MPAEAAREPDRQADGEAGRVARVQPADGSRVPATGGLPAVLGVPTPVVGGEVPVRVDAASDAIAAGADEEGGQDDQEPSAADPELVPGQGRGLVGRGGGAQQQGEVDDEKVVRVPDGEIGEIGSIAQPRTAPGARTHPQILLRRLKRLQEKHKTRLL